MTDLHTLLNAAADASVTSSPTPSLVEADLLRAQRSLRRRRAARGARAGLVTVAAAVVVALAVPGGALPAPRSSSVTSAPVALVDYGDAQPEGYTVDSVPAGWVLRGSNVDVLTITRPDDVGDWTGAAPSESSSGGPGAPTSDAQRRAIVGASLEGRLVVSLISSDGRFPTEGTSVSVGGAPGVITGDSRGSQILYYPDAASGRTVTVQVPSDLGWSPEQISTFAQGVHVTAAARASNG